MPTSKDLTDLDSQLKKTVISAESFKRGSSSKNILNIHKTLSTLAGHTRKLTLRFIDLEKSLKLNTRSISILTNLSKSQSARISGENIGAKLPGSSSSKVEDNISAIAKSVNSIAEILEGRKKITEDAAAYERRRAEQEKRGLAESKLEKVFKGIAKTAEKIIAPVKSLLDRILDFIGTVILGRIVFKLIEWLGDKKNQGKVKSIIRFFKDWGPTLLSLYIVFGTSFGKFARGLISLVIKSTVRLGAAVAGLATRAGIGRAGRVARFLGGRKGKLLAAGLEAGVTVAGTMALSNTLKGDGGDKAPEQPTQKFSGGGLAIPRFSGGGFNFKGMLSGAGKGAMFGPLGMLLGGAMGGSSGFVSGPGGPKDDKVPAMLSDGEFVMSAGAVQKYGVDTLEAMNAAGGGTNKPKVINGTTYAASGGPIGRTGGLYSGSGSVEELREQINNFFRGGGSGNNFDIGKPSTWGRNRPGISVSGSGGSTPTGSLLNDPLGAIQRISGNMGGNRPSPSNSGNRNRPSSSGTPTGSLLNDPLGAIQRISGNMGGNRPSPSSSAPSPSKPKGSSTPNVPQKSGSPLDMLYDKLPGGKYIKEIADNADSSPFRDAGAAFFKHNLGGFGGPLSERDLSGASRSEIQKAIVRAKKRSAQQVRINQMELDTLLKNPPKPGQDRKKWNDAVATKKSFLKKAKDGAIQVKYQDYVDEKGNLSKDAANTKLILGQFWAHERDKKDGGGYRIEDKYDFLNMTKTDPKTGKKRDLTNEELFNEVLLGKDKSLKQRLQAVYLMNPFKGKGDVDMVLGGNRTAAESWGLSASKTLLGGMLGVSGKPKDKNTQALEAKRPWWDKMGMFGGASAQMKREQQERKDFEKRNTGAKLFDKPQKNTGQSYKSRFARPKNAGVKPIKPPTSPKPKVVYGPPAPSKRQQYRGGQRASTRTPSFSATNPKASNSKAKVVGVKG